MDQKQYDQGLATRRAVLGTDYVVAREEPASG
jgi:hypothetical protein